MKGFHGIRESVIEMESLDNNGLDGYLTEVNDAKKIIQDIKSDVEKVNLLQNKILSSPSLDEKTMKELDDLRTEVKLKSQRIRTKLKAMKEANFKAEEENGVTAFTRIRKTQQASLQQNLLDLMHQYQFAQMDYKDKCKAQIKRQIEITGSNLSEDKVDDMIEQGNWSVFTEGMLLESKQARQILEDVEARHQEMVKLEQSLKDLHEMFVEMALLVESQGEVIDNIAKNVASTEEYVDDGTHELKKAKQLQTKVRKKKICIIITVIILLIIALVVILKLCKVF